MNRNHEFENMQQREGKDEVIHQEQFHTPGGAIVETEGLSPADRSRMAQRVELPHWFGVHWRYPRKKKPRVKFIPCEGCGNLCRSGLCHKCATRSESLPLCYCGHSKEAHSGRTAAFGEFFPGLCSVQGDGINSLDCLCPEYRPAARWPPVE